MPRLAKRRRAYGKGKPKHYRRSHKKKKQATYARTAGRALNLNLAGPTLQIATRVRRSQRMKFAWNETFNYNPEKSVLADKQDFFRIGFNANSIVSLFARDNMRGNASPAGLWTAQNSLHSPSGGTEPNVYGWNFWKDRYRKFTVLGSKITVVAKTVLFQSGMAEPTLVFLHKTGSDTPSAIFGTVTGAEDVNKHPCVTKAHLMSSNVSTGCTLTQSYSAREFEGLKDPEDNDDCQGGTTPVVQPHIQTTYILGICNSRGRVNQPNVTLGSPVIGATPPLQIQVKLEYIVLMQEPDTDELVMPGVPPGQGV